MSKLFEVKHKDIRRLRKFYKNAPGQFKKAATGVLNDFAFGVRKSSVETISRKMVVRNSKFVSGSLRVQKARGGNLKSLSSETGSIHRKRFSGWAEQELGTKSSRTKVVSRFGRSGSKTGMLKPSFRMKPAARFIKSSDFEGKNKKQKTRAMLQTVSRRKTSRPFLITGLRRFSSGLYKMQNQKIQRIQKFKTRSQPKRIKWHTIAKNQYFGSVSVRNVWAKNIRRTLKF